MQSVTMQIHDDIAVVIVNNPPVNALSWHVRQGLHDSFSSALADASVKAIVLRCDGSTFIAGADITEFGKITVSAFKGCVGHGRIRRQLDEWKQEQGQD